MPRSPATMVSMPLNASDINRFLDDYRRTREQIQRAIVGHEDIIDGVLTCLFAGGHALLEEGSNGRVGVIRTNRRL